MVFLTASGSLTSRVTGRTASPSSAASFASLSSLRATAMTRAPSATNRRAMASPKPALAPVTNTVCWVMAWLRLRLGTC